MEAKEVCVINKKEVSKETESTFSVTKYLADPFVLARESDDAFLIFYFIAEAMAKSDTALTQLDIRRSIGNKNYTKKTINSALYHNRRWFYMHDGAPPQWTLTKEGEERYRDHKRNPEEQSEHPCEDVYVFVDLNAFSKLAIGLEDYPHARVAGFFSYPYEGEKTKILFETPRHVPEGTHAMMSNAFFGCYEKTKGKACYIICSYHQTFLSYPKLYNRTRIVKDWDSMKLEL